MGTGRLALAADLGDLVTGVDDVTGMHVRRVAAGALIIAEAMGLDERCKRGIERVALFHDIGKVHEALFDIVHDDDGILGQPFAARRLDALEGVRPHDLVFRRAGEREPHRRSIVGIFDRAGEHIVASGR